MKKFDVIILGGGTAGITVAARLKRKGIFDKICIIDPSDFHYYQPLWSLVGNGLIDKEKTRRPMRKIIPTGISWIKESVTAINPSLNQVSTDTNILHYKYLVVATGIVPDWGFVEGLADTIHRNGVFTIYNYEDADYGYEILKNLDRGRILFTMPSGLLKCGGAPQKIMWLCEDFVSKYKKRNQFEFHFYKEGDGIFGINKYRRVLEKMVIARGIQTHYKSKLVKVDGPQKKALFEKLDNGEVHSIEFDLLHVVPHFTTHDFVQKSSLSNEKGEIAVDQSTLQSTHYPNVFSLGDCSSCPTGKTGAAIRKQAPVLVDNLIALHQKKNLFAKYSGYTACPILTRRNKVILAEFDYNGDPVESFFFDQSKESYFLFLFKRYILPFLYWNLMLRGLI